MNLTQCHKCGDSCLKCKKIKAIIEKVCRFQFPKEAAEKSKVIFQSYIKRNGIKNTVTKINVERPPQCLWLN